MNKLSQSNFNIKNSFGMFLISLILTACGGKEVTNKVTSNNTAVQNHSETNSDSDNTSTAATVNESTTDIDIFNEDNQNPRRSFKIFEDAENGNTLDWRVYDNTPAGATIENVTDAAKSSKVIELQGTSTQNGYILGNWENRAGAWNDMENKQIRWSMNYAENFVVYIRVQTTNGPRYIYYTASEKARGISSNNSIYIHHGLGVDAKNGNWQTFTRDLEADLKHFESDNELLAVNAFLMRGSGRVDDIELLSNLSIADTTAPLITLNGDAQIEVALGATYTDAGATASDYVTSPVNVTTEGAVNTAVSGFYTIVYTATDAAGNTATTSRTVRVNSPDGTMTYEDAEDGNTLGWRVYDKTPTGATIENVTDAAKSSKVIELQGTGTQNGYILGNWEDRAGAWNDTENKHINWNMNFDESFVVYIRVQTTNGPRYIYYTASDTDKGLSTNGIYIHYGLGTAAKNGSWQSFTRDLEADLKAVESDNELLAVNAFLVRGSGRVDDIKLSGDITSPAYQIKFMVNGIELPATTVPRNLSTELFEQGLSLFAIVVDADGNTVADAVPTPDITTVDLTIVGEYQLTYSYTYDDTTITKDLTVIVENHLPSATGQTVTVSEDTSNNPITLSGSDSNQGDTLTYAIATPPSHGSLSGTAPSLMYTPNPNYAGTDTFTFTLSDNTDTSAPATVTINVTDVAEPVVLVAVAQTVIVDEDTTNNLITLVSTGGDSNLMDYIISSGPSHGTLDGTAPNLTYTPTANYFGADSFTFLVSDGVESSSPATVTITINDVAEPINAVPVAQAQTIPVNEDGSVTFTILGTDTDTSDTSLVYALHNDSGVTHGTLEGTIGSSSAGNELTYQPIANYFGDDSFYFTVSDGKATSAPAKVTFDVVSVNDAPTVEAGTDTTVDINIPVTLNGSGADIDGTISFDWLENGTPLPDGNTASYVYTPTVAGTHTLTLTVTDNEGATASDTVVVTVTDVNNEFVTVLNQTCGIALDTIAANFNSITGEYNGDITCTTLNATKFATFKALKKIGNLNTSDIRGTTSLNALTNLTSANSLTLNKISPYEYYGDSNPLNLNGISQVVDLKDLTLEHNFIRNLSPLANLTDLTNLNLYDNEVSDLAPLSGLTKLKVLKLTTNEISSLAPLSGLINLEDLDLYLNDNQNWNIDSLSNLTKLKKLDIAGSSYFNYTHIDNIDGLSAMTDMEYLKLSYNKIIDVSSLSNMTKLKDLDLDNNKVVDINALSNLTNLLSLDLRNNLIESTNPLIALTSINYLGLTGNPLKDLSGLENIEQRADSNNNGVGNISIDEHALDFYTTLPNKNSKLCKSDKVKINGTVAKNHAICLQVSYSDEELAFINTLTNKCHISSTDIGNNFDADTGIYTGSISCYGSNDVNLKMTDADLATFSVLKKVDTLSLGNNSITDLTPLSHLTELKSLQLYRNQISDLSPISSLTGLNELNVNENQISDISTLSSLTSLDILDLSNNPITDISALNQMISIKELNLEGISTITDLSPLENIQYGMRNVDRNEYTDSYYEDEDLITAGNIYIDNHPAGHYTKLPSKKSSLCLSDSIYIGYGIEPLAKDHSICVNGSTPTDLNLADADVDAFTNIITQRCYLSLTEAQTNFDRTTGIYYEANSYEGNGGGLYCYGFSDPKMNDAELERLHVLTRIGTLQLGENSITDLSPLSGLTNVRELSLDGNQMTSLAPLSSLTSVQIFSLRDNIISDVNGLNAITAIGDIDLSNSPNLTDLSGLENINQNIPSIVEEFYEDLDTGEEVEEKLYMTGGTIYIDDHDISFYTNLPAPDSPLCKSHDIYISSYSDTTSSYSLAKDHAICRD